METSNIPENTHDARPPPIITPPGIGSQPTLRNLRLSHEWIIGEPIPKENERHATVYSVLDSRTGQAAEGLEAHVFAFDAIEPKLRKHRQRRIKRMEGRMKLKLEVDKVTIVVITTLLTAISGASESEEEPLSLSNDGQQETDGGTAPVGNVKQKTLYQRELQRIRQSERRQAKRAAKTQKRCEETADGGHKMTEKIDQEILSDGKNEFSMFLSLIHQLLDSWDLWAEIPVLYTSLANNIEGGRLHEALNEYLLQTAASLRIIEEMESYLKARRNEIISLRRHRAKILR